jgi:hypothetical protein
MNLANINGPPGRPFRLPPTLSLLYRQESLNVLALSLQRTTVLKYTVMIPIGVKRFEDVIGYIADDRVDLQPVVESIVLGIVEFLYFLIRKTFYLDNMISVEIPSDRIQ